MNILHKALHPKNFFVDFSTVIQIDPSASNKEIPMPSTEIKVIESLDAFKFVYGNEVTFYPVHANLFTNNCNFKLKMRSISCVKGNSTKVFGYHLSTAGRNNTDSGVEETLFIR